MVCSFLYSYAAPLAYPDATNIETGAEARSQGPDPHRRQEGRQGLDRQANERHAVSAKSQRVSGGVSSQAAHLDAPSRAATLGLAFLRQHRSPTVFDEFGGFQDNQASGRFRQIDSTTANQTNDGVVIRFRISAV